MVLLQFRVSAMYLNLDGNYSCSTFSNYFLYSIQSCVVVEISIYYIYYHFQKCLKN